MTLCVMCMCVYVSPWPVSVSGLSTALISSTVLNALISKLDRRRAKDGGKGSSFRAKRREKSLPSSLPVPSDAPGWAIKPEYTYTSSSISYSIFCCYTYITGIWSYSIHRYFLPVSCHTNKVKCAPCWCKAYPDAGRWIRLIWHW